MCVRLQIGGNGVQATADRISMRVDMSRRFYHPGKIELSPEATTNDSYTSVGRTCPLGASNRIAGRRKATREFGAQAYLNPTDRLTQTRHKHDGPALYTTKTSELPSLGATHVVRTRLQHSSAGVRIRAETLVLSRGSTRELQKEAARRFAWTRFPRLFSTLQTLFAKSGERR